MRAAGLCGDTRGGDGMQPCQQYAGHGPLRAAEDPVAAGDPAPTAARRGECLTVTSCAPNGLALRIVQCESRGAPGECIRAGLQSPKATCSSTTAFGGSLPRVSGRST